MMRFQPTGFRAKWSPWTDLARVQEEMDRLFHSSNDSYAPGFPSVNVWTSKEEAVLSADVPGVSADKIEISVLDDTVTLKGERSVAETPEDSVAHRQERGSGAFARTIRLPFRVEASAVDAKYENGVLEVRLPRAEADRPKQITVQAA